MVAAEYAEEQVYILSLLKTTILLAALLPLHHK